MKAALLAIILTITCVSCHLRWHDGDHMNYTFNHYKAEFNREYATQDEHNFRQLIFNTNLEKIIAHNKNPNKRWTAGVNHLTDKIGSEITTGLNRDLHFYTYKANTAKFSQDFLQNLPNSVDWRREGKVLPIKNQGKCGSCWTFSATSVLESHIAIQHNKLISLSEQQLVDCALNPHNCGGTGGCNGSTQELAFDYVSKSGLALESDYQYFAKDGKCRTGVKSAITIEGYTQLPANDYNALMQALATVGPIGVSVSADEWHLYQSGVYDGGCGYGINHAVTAVGYGTDENGDDYWIIRNSWGTGWGEEGYMRLYKEKTAAEKICGIDKNPSTGFECDGGPEEIEVCGTCGVLSSSSYPFGGRFQ